MSDPVRDPARETQIKVRHQLESAHCIQEFSAVVHGATAPDGTSAVILGLFPAHGPGWTFPLPVAEARRVAALLIEVAGAKEGERV